MRDGLEGLVHLPVIVKGGRGRCPNESPVNYQRNASGLLMNNGLGAVSPVNLILDEEAYYLSFDDGLFKALSSQL